MDGSLIDKYQYPCLAAPGGLVPCKLSINKHRNGDFVSPCFRHIRSNSLICILIEIKPVVLLEELRNDYWVATIKH